MREQSATKKSDSWRKHIESWKASGLTRRQYCSKNGVSFASLGYWQWKMGSSEVRTKKADQNLLVPIRVTESKPVEVSLWIGDHMKMVFPSTVDPAWVSSVIDSARTMRQ